MAVVTGSAVLAADRAGDLDAALELAHLLQLAAGRGGLADRVEAFRLLARVRRHRGEPAAALEAAEHAARLIRLPRLEHDERLAAAVTLDLAACLVDTGQPSEAIGLAQRWRRDASPQLSGRAWSVMGRSMLERGDIDGAVAALGNALAESGRTSSLDGPSWPRTMMGLALTRAGEADQAGLLLEGDLDAWADRDDSRRLRIGHGLILAENRVARGDIAAASELLTQVRRDLKACTGLDTEVRLVRRLRAECLAAWGLLAEARGELDRMGAGPSVAVRSSVGTPRVPERPAPSTLGAAAAPRHTGPGLPTPTTSRNRLRALLDPARTREVELVRQLLDEFLVLDGARTIDAASWLLERVEGLDGDPDGARAQAVAYVEAGAALRDCRGGPFLLHSERALRRALVLLARLQGMGLWLARGRVELARTLRRAHRPQEALRHALVGVQELDRVRFLMQHRRHRDAWTMAETSPSIDLAIELAVACGETTIASDLIVFSRAAGVVAPRGRDSGGPDIALLPVPRLRYIDGGASSMGSSGECVFC